MLGRRQVLSWWRLVFEVRYGMGNQEHTGGHKVAVLATTSGAHAGLRDCWGNGHDRPGR